VQIVKKGDIPIEVKIIALFTMAIGAVETVAISAMFADDPGWMFWQTDVLDRLRMYIGGITNGIPAGDGRSVSYDWILAEGLITVAIGFFLLRGYRAAWIAIIALSVFRLAMFAPFYALPYIVPNALIIFFMIRPRVLRFFFRKEKLVS
jgi:hypothetical protein